MDNTDKRFKDNNISRRVKLKTLKEGEEFPFDFWNYDVNPILGRKYIQNSLTGNRLTKNQRKKYNTELSNY